MADFTRSYLGQLRQLVGARTILMPGARMIVERPDGALLVHLRSDYRAWAFPGGVPDENEDLVTTVVRETFEETGVRPLNAVAYGFASDPAHEIRTYPNGDVCHYFSLLFYATAFEGDLAPDNDESLEVRWALRAQLPPLMPIMTRTLAALDRWKHTGAFQLI